MAHWLKARAAQPATLTVSPGWKERGVSLTLSAAVIPVVRPQMPMRTPTPHSHKGCAGELLRLTQKSLDCV